MLLAKELAINEEMKFFAIGDAKYHIKDTTQVFHAEIHDSNNTTNLLIHGSNQDHGYHSSGLKSGDLTGWTFGAGSAGTSSYRARAN